MITEVDEKYKIVDNKYQWFLYARTPIEETSIDGLTIRTLNHNFTPIAALDYDTNPDTSIGNLTQLFSALS